MGRVRRSNARERLAEYAAERLGLAGAEAVAADASAREHRDLLWQEYERQLRDTQTYTLDDVRSWLKDHGTRVGRSTIHRDRHDLLAKDRVYSLAAGKARAFLDAAGLDGEHDILRGARLAAGQILFETLTQFPAAALEGLDPQLFLRAVRTVADLSKAHAETDLINQRLTDQRERHEREIRERTDAAAKTKADGRLGREDVYRIIDEVMKGDAA